MDSFKMMFKKYSKIILGVVLLFFIFIYLFAFKQSFLNPEERKLYQVSTDADEVVGEMVQNERYVQSFKMPTDKMSGFEFYAANYGRENSSKILTVKLKDPNDKSVIYTWKVPLKDVKDNSFFRFIVDEEISMVKGKTYNIELSSDALPGEAITLYKTDADKYSDGEFYVNGVLQESDLVFSVVSSESTTVLVTLFITFMCLVMGLIIVVMIVVNRKRKVKIEAVFVIMALVFGLIFMVMLPPLSAPDEHRHFITAYHTSNKILGKQATDDIGRVMIRACDKEHYNRNPNTRSLVYFYGSEKILDTTMVPHTDPPLNVNILNHLPQAIGIAIGRLLGFGYTGVSLMGRATNLLTYIAFIWFAIRKIPFGKLALFVLALSPMALELAASYSYDTICIAAAFAAIAYLLHIIFKKEKVSITDFVIVGLFTVIAAFVKPMYLGIAFLLFLVPQKKYKKHMYYWFTNTGIIILLVAIYVLFSYSTLQNVIGADQVVVHWAQEPSYTLSSVLSNLGNTLKMYYQTFQEEGVFYLFSTFGYRLGWLDVPIPETIIVMYIITLMLSLISHKEPEYKITPFMRIWASLIFLGVVLLVMLALLLDWTPISSKTIQGVQGRYFIPALPLFILVFHNQVIVAKKSLNNIVYGLLVGVNLMTCITALQTILSR